MRKLARKYVIWNGLNSDIENFVKICEKCQDGLKDNGKFLSIISDDAGRYQGLMDYRKSWEEMLENHTNLLTAKDSMASANRLNSADLQ
jgi:hypothetical protein